MRLSSASESFEVKRSPLCRGSSLLQRQGLYILPGAMIMYILLQTLVGRSKFCTGSRPFSEWTSYYYFGAGFSFITSSAQQMSRTYSCWRQNICSKGILFLAAMTISIIAGSSSLLTYGMNYGGICVDIFGIESPAAQWSEWIVSVPLMAYLAVSVEDKLRLTKSDYFVISSLSFAVICGAVMNFKYENKSAGIVLFLLGCFSLVISFFHVRRSKVQEGLALDRANLNRISDDEIIAESKKIFLTRLICAVFPQFPIFYLFGFFRILDRDQLYVAFALLSVAAKLLFVSALVDEQIHVTEQIRVHREAETKFNDTRRSFLRYLFHELRTPLNTITLGMAVIENNRENVVATRRDALIMMNGATTFISRILNDVLCVHEIEEGALKITKKPFHVEAIIRDAMAGTQQSATVKHTQVVFGDGESNSTIDSTSPLLMGDQQKLLDVLTSFIENAIKRSNPLSRVTITLSKKFNDVIFPCSRLRKVMNIMSHSFSERSGMDRSSEGSRSVARSLPPVALPRGPSYFRAHNDNILRHFRERNEGHVDDDVAGASNPLGGRDHGLFLCPNSSVREPRPINASFNCAIRSCNVEVLVIDRGERVSEDDLQGLIQPYRQIRPDLSDEGRGTGLWLVLAQEILALHGGSVLFDSSSEGGNTFGFRVPFGIATPAEQRDADISHILNGSINQVNTADNESSKSNSITSRHTERERKYLIVDDTPSNSKMLAMLLRGRGITSDTANNGQEALDLVSEQGEIYDLIFMDFTMPIMNGGDATSAIRKSGFDGLIVGLTGNALDDNVDIFLHAGADCVIAKPFRAAQMDALIQHTKVHGMKSQTPSKFRLETTVDHKCVMRFL